MFAKHSNRGPSPCREKWLALVGLSVFWAGSSTAQGVGGSSAPTPPEIEYAYPSPSVWTSRLNSRGEPENPLLKVADALFRKAGLPWHGANYPAARVFENLRNGTSDFSMLVYSPVIGDCCLTSKRPVAATELRVYHLAHQPPVTRRDALVGRNIITVLGYSYGGLRTFFDDPQNRITNNAVSTHEAAFAMLEKGRADYLIDYIGPAGEILAAHPMPNLKSELLQPIEVHLILSKKVPDGPRLMTRLEEAMNSLGEKGQPHARPKAPPLPGKE